MTTATSRCSCSGCERRPRRAQISKWYTNLNSIASLGIVTVAVLFASGEVSAQGLAGMLQGGNGASQQTPAADPLKRSTPRSSIYNFLQACHNNNFSLASQYLDLRKLRPAERETRGIELAQQLSSIFDHTPGFELNRLSNSSQGDLTDGLSADLDNLYSFQVNGQPVVLQMQRRNELGADVWLVSADSLALIPELSATIGESTVEKKLPRSLVRNKFMGSPLWTWLTIILLALTLSLLSRLLSRAVIAVLKPLTRRYAKSVSTYRLEAFTEPLRLLLSVAVLRACLDALAFSALARVYILNGLTLLFIIGAASLVMRIVDVVSDHAISRLDPRQRTISYSVVPLFVRIVKIFVFCVAALFVLTAWGYSSSTILAGVGVGGIAVALAAQKTIENLFGTLSIISDRPVLVGDFCQFGGQNGTVEDIGLRSTRIRTNDRTLVTIPNSVFSNMTLENYSRRDRMWFHPTLRLRRDTEPHQIEQMMEAVTKILQKHEQVDASGVPLRFTKITDNSYDLEIFAYVLTPDSNQFLLVQSELLLQIMQAASRLQVGFAVPFQESVTAVTRHDGFLPGSRPSLGPANDVAHNEELEPQHIGDNAS